RQQTGSSGYSINPQPPMFMRVTGIFQGRLSQPDATCVALEQENTKVFLQGFEPGADAGLGDAQCQGRLSKTQIFGDSKRLAQRSKRNSGTEEIFCTRLPGFQDGIAFHRGGRFKDISGGEPRAVHIADAWPALVRSKAILKMER